MSKKMDCGPIMVNFTHLRLHSNFNYHNTMDFDDENDGDPEE